MVLLDLNMVFFTTTPTNKNTFNAEFDNEIVKNLPFDDFNSRNFW